MSVVRLRRFSTQQPRVSSTQRSSAMADLAVNARLDNGEIRPFFVPEDNADGVISRDYIPRDLHFFTASAGVPRWLTWNTAPLADFDQRKKIWVADTVDGFVPPAYTYAGGLEIPTKNPPSSFSPWPFDYLTGEKRDFVGPTSAGLWTFSRHMSSSYAGDNPNTGPLNYSVRTCTFLLPFPAGVPGLHAFSLYADYLELDNADSAAFYLDPTGAADGASENISGYLDSGDTASDVTPIYTSSAVYSSLNPIKFSVYLATQMTAPSYPAYDISGTSRARFKIVMTVSGVQYYCSIDVSSYVTRHSD